MLYEFALDPAVLTSWESFRFLADQFGPQHGRMISLFPRKWKKLVTDACLSSKCRPIEKTKIIQRLSEKNFDKKLIDMARNYNGEKPWLENAESDHRRKPFRAIITSVNPSGMAEVLIADDIDESQSLWNVRRGDHIPSKAEDLAGAIAPFLALSSEIIFVDPHFNPAEQRFRRPLEQFILHAVGFGRPIARFEYHLEYDDKKPSREHFENECRQKLSNLIPRGVQVKFVRWKQRDGGKEFHARFILTDVGGIDFDPGLDERDDGAVTKLGLLDPGVYSTIRQDFQRSMDISPAYEFVDEVIITGDRK